MSSAIRYDDHSQRRITRGRQTGWGSAGRTASVAPVERTQVDGVPVFWTHGPPPLSAGLVFGVGRQDETFLRGGLTHLVEHLVMSSLGRTTLDCNASVDLTSTAFTATGPPERVVEFLRHVCTTLGDLPTDRLSVEVDVLRVEGGGVASPAVGALLAAKYGARGPGLGGFSEPALQRLSTQDVRGWASSRFIRGRAALWLTGPPPEGLSLPLFDGTPSERTAPVARALATPALVEHPLDGSVVLGAELPQSAVLDVTRRVLAVRAEDDLRHRRGLSYSIEIDKLAVTADRRFVVMSADCREDEEALVARAVWRVLSELATTGCTAEELQRDREELEAYLLDPRSALDEVQAAARATVAGTTAPDEQALRQEHEAVTPYAVQGAARAWREAALLGVPEDTDLDLPGLTRMEPWSADVVAGRTYRRALHSAAPRGARLIVGEDGVTVVLDAEERLTVRFDEAVALLQDEPGVWTLLGADGTSIPLAVGDWRGGADALARVRAAVPEQLQADADGDAPSARSVLLAHAPPYAVQEVLWPSKRPAWLVSEEPWTLVARQQDELEQLGDAAGMSAGLGRKHAVLQLTLERGELELVVWHRGKERSRHLWSGQPDDPSALVELVGADCEATAEVLALAGRPQELVEALVRTLGLPAQTWPALSGTSYDEVPGLTHHAARGVRESFAAAVRGDFDPPDGTAWHHRMLRWERERPPAYRAANAVAAVAQAGLAAVLAPTAGGDWTSWSGLLTVLFGVGAVGNGYSALPRRRRRSAPAPSAE